MKIRKMLFVLSTVLSAFAFGDTLVLKPGDVEIVLDSANDPEFAPNVPSAKGPGVGAKFAAEELKSLLEESFGAEIPVVSKATGTRKAIALALDATFERDDIRLVTDANGVKIVSGEAKVYGVYEFLERYAGMRFYFPGPLGTIVPKHASIEVPFGTVDVKPDYTQRSCDMSWGHNGDWYKPDGLGKATEAEYRALSSKARARMRLAPQIPCCHGLARYYDLEKRFGKTHPEYFALLKDEKGGYYRDDANSKWTGHHGQLCHTSAVWDEIYRTAAQKMRAGEKYIDVMAQDGMQKCLCDKCLAAYSQDPDEANYATELIWGNTAKLARRLAADGFKGYVTQMSYRPYAKIPQVDLPENLLVMVATRGPWSVTNPAKMAKENATIRAWAKKLGHKVWIWNYAGKFGRKMKNVDIPQMTPRAIGAYYKSLPDAIIGGYLESRTDRWIYNYLNYYVFNKVCWDTKADVDAILAEHDRLMFGPAAAEMRAYYDRLEELWLNRVSANCVDTALGPVEAEPTASQKWCDIYSEKVIAEFEGYLTRAVAKVPADSLEAKRIAFIRYHFFDPMKAASDAYLDAVDVARNEAKRAARENRSILKGTVFDTEEPFVLGGEKKARAPVALLAGRLAPNTTYCVSYFSKYEDVVVTNFSGYGQGAGVTVYDGKNGKVFPGRRQRVGSHDWQYASFDFTTSDAPNRQAKFGIQLDKCSGRALFRGIRIEPRQIALTATNTEVVVWAYASPVTRFTADEMVKFLSRILGGPVPLVHAPTENGRVSIFVGHNTWSAAAKIDPKKLSRDAYFVKTEGTDVYIVGNDRSDFSWKEAMAANLDCERATLFGVYGWLEEVAGVRFIWPDDELGTIVPRKDAIVLSNGMKTVTPDFLQRYPYFWADGRPRGWPKKKYGGYDAKGMLWMRLRLATCEIPCCHGSCHFQYVQRFGKTHPEYFSRKKDGSVMTDLSHYGASQLCWSNPGLREEIYQDVKAYLTGQKPETRGLKQWGRNCKYGKYVDIMPDDGFQPCFCPDCQKVFVEGRRKYGRQYATELIWDACREIGNRLIAEKVPGSISMMAYSPYSVVPPFDLPTNVEVMVALRGPWSLVDPKGYETDMQRVTDWSKKVGHRVLTWTYPHKYNATMIPGVPCFAPHAWGKYYAAQRDVSFGGFMECESDSSFYNFLNYYVFSHVMWDSHTDVDALLDEAYGLMFGAGASEMKTFFALLEEKWTRGVAGHVIDTDVGPQTVPPTQKELWESIYSPAFRQQLDGLLKAAAAKVPEGSLEAKRMAVMRREFYTPMGEGFKAYQKLKNDVDACVFDIRKGPLDVNVWRVTKKEREVATVKTRFGAELTKDELVVSVDCMEPEMDSVSCPYEGMGSDKLWNNDNVEIYLNPSADRTRIFHFVLCSNGAGSVGYEDIKSGKPESWSMPKGVVWKARHTVKGWTGELRVPRALLKDMAPSFPANFCRFRQLKGKKPEMIMWNRYTFLFGDLEHFGTMVVGPLD